MKTDKVPDRGLGVIGVIGIILVVLKLVHTIDWPWMWVTVPFWGPFALIAAIFVVLAFVFAAVAIGNIIYIWAKGEHDGE